MKLQYIILLLYVLLLNGPVNAQNVEIINPKIEAIGSNLRISFDVKVAKVATNYMLTLTPVLWNGSNELPLTSMIVIGRNMTILRLREGKIGVGKRLENTATITSYEAIAPFEPWMEGVSLRINRMIEGCCKREMLAPISIVSNKIKSVLLTLTPQFNGDQNATSLRDFKEKIKDYSFVGYIGDEASPKGLDIYFELGRSVVNESFMENAISIRKIEEAIEIIKSSDHMELARINITGGASPEGTVINNKILGQNRARAVINYFSTEIDADMFFVENIGENWDGLYRMVESSDMKYRDEVLAIIRNYPINEEREKQLMKLGRGKPYNYLLKNFFPELRRASYLQLYYDVKPHDDDSKIDEALEFMKRNNYNDAIEILQEMNPTPYIDNLIGVCYMMMEHIVKARVYFQQAVDGGNSDAKQNIKLLNYQRDNIQYK